MIVWPGAIANSSGPLADELSGARPAFGRNDRSREAWVPPAQLDRPQVVDGVNHVLAADLGACRDDALLGHIFGRF